MEDWTLAGSPAPAEGRAPCLLANLLSFLHGGRGLEVISSQNQALSDRWRLDRMTCEKPCGSGSSGWNGIARTSVCVFSLAHALQGMSSLRSLLSLGMTVHPAASSSSDLCPQDVEPGTGSLSALWVGQAFSSPAPASAAQDVGIPGWPSLKGQGQPPSAPGHPSSSCSPSRPWPSAAPR